MFHYQDTVVVNGVSVDVSTIDLSSTGFGHGYETCLFFTGGDSDVVDSYSSIEAAKAGHQAWLDEARIVKAWEDYRALWA